MTILEPVIEFLYGYKGPTIALCQLLDGVDRPRKPVLRVMDRLVKTGHLQEIEDNRCELKFGEVGPPRRNPTWRIIKKPMLEAFVPRPARTTLRDKMWRLIRARRRFTRRELMRLAGCGEGSATNYTQLLEHHGYIRRIGKDGHQHVYMLTRDPGSKRPLTPEVNKKC